MKNTFFIACLSFFSLTSIKAQENQITETLPKSENKLYVKGNALLLPILVINTGLEYQLNKKYTLQGDILISPWKSFAGHELQYYSLSVEGRYYFKEAFEGWYLGANIGVSSFVLQKWNYWSDEIFQLNSESEVFIKSNLYQKGYSFLAGITGGYQFKLSDNWRMELYATVGTSQDFYKGYERGTGKRYDEANAYNRSGEIIPYRGGVMISYRLK